MKSLVGAETVCEGCGNSFTAADKRRRYCSKGCSSRVNARTRVADKNSNWRGGKTLHPLYDTYMDMVGRCHRPTHARYDDYGARGIQVCDRWRTDFWAFVADMGERPPGRSLDRANNDLGYDDANCRWATAAEQRNNRREQTPRTSCPNGHEYTPDNTIFNPRGFRQCVTCAKATRERHRSTHSTAGTKGRKTSPATDRNKELAAQFVELGGDNRAVDVLAETLGVTRDSVRRRLRRGGVANPPVRTPAEVVRKSRYSQADRQKMRSLYDSGVSQSAIARRFGTNQGYVHKLLSKTPATPTPAERNGAS